MHHKTWIFWAALVLLGIVSLVAYPVAADSQPQVVYQTPTARPDGRIIYIVQSNDTCTSIYLKTGATIDQLRSLNKLDQNCTIAPGQELLLKIVTPVPTATLNPFSSPTPLLPTLTPQIGSGQICVLLYDDINGNAVHEASEGSLAGGAVSITNTSGLDVSKTINTTDSTDPICEDVPEGTYNISMAIPSGYNPTKAMNAVTQVKAGDQQIFEFGAQESSALPQNSTGNAAAQPGENRIPLAVLGGLFVLLGIGLGGYIVFTRRHAAG